MKKLMFFPTIASLLFAVQLIIAPLYAQAAYQTPSPTAGQSSTTNPTSPTIGQSGAASSACAGIQQLDSSQTCGTCTSPQQTSGSQNCGSSSTIGSIIGSVVTILSFALGGIAVIMIIISGIRFATSGGNSNSVSGAKKTLIYAVIGLAIAILAQVIVSWVVGTSVGL